MGKFMGAVFGLFDAEYDNSTYKTELVDAAYQHISHAKGTTCKSPEKIATILTGVEKLKQSA